MVFNFQKLQYISYHLSESLHNDNVYVTPDRNFVSKPTEVKDLGILMSQSCDFDRHIASTTNRCLFKTM